MAILVLVVIGEDEIVDFKVKFQSNTKSRFLFNKFYKTLEVKLAANFGIPLSNSYK